MLVILTTVFQFAYLLSARQPCEPVRRWANRLATYDYRILRYITLNENARPLPFQDFPAELEPPAADITFPG